MEPNDFINTLYLGDRGCKKITIDGWNEIVKIQVTTISRVRGEDWNYYKDEDIEDGYIVFSSVEAIHFEPSNYIPNDTINYLSVEKVEDRDTFIFTFSAYSANKEGECVEVITTITAKQIYLEDSLQREKLT